MENDIIIKETTLEEALNVHKNVLEFDDTNASKEVFENRYQDAEKLIIVAYYQRNPIGYMIGYDRFKDNKENFYCWVAGVDFRYRRMGTLKKLMQYQENWAREKGYKNLRIKTRNNRREMLSFLVKSEFYFMSVEEQEKIENNRINLVKKLN